jgi:hypothetical protein
VSLIDRVDTMVRALHRRADQFDDIPMLAGGASEGLL